jgi:hypothetical protein
MGEEGDIASKMVFLKWMSLLNIHRQEVTQRAILLLQFPNKKLQVLSLELNRSTASPSIQIERYCPANVTAHFRVFVSALHIKKTPPFLGP